MTWKVTIIIDHSILILFFSFLLYTLYAVMSIAPLTSPNRLLVRSRVARSWYEHYTYQVITYQKYKMLFAINGWDRMQNLVSVRCSVELPRFFIFV